MSSILDPLTTGIFFVIFAIAALVSLGLFNSLTASGGIFATYATPMAKFYTALDNTALFIVLGMSLAAMASAFLIRSHPIFFIISVVLIFVLFIIIPIMVNAFNSFATNGQYTAEVAQMAQTVQLIQYLPVLTAVISLGAALLGIMREQ